MPRTKPREIVVLKITADRDLQAALEQHRNAAGLSTLEAAAHELIRMGLASDPRDAFVHLARWRALHGVRVWAFQQLAAFFAEKGADAEKFAASGQNEIDRLLAEAKLYQSPEDAPDA